MGGIGCCLPRNVYVAPQSSGEMLIWCETELINWFALVKAAGIIRSNRPYQINRTQSSDIFADLNDTESPPTSSVTYVVLTVSCVWVLKNVWWPEIVRHDIISEMCASMVILGWKLNCKRQTWISLCLSLSSWQEQSQNFGWRSSWPRCSVQISATRWQWRPLHRLDDTVKPQRVLYSKVKRALVEQFTLGLLLFMDLWWRCSPNRSLDNILTTVRTALVLRVWYFELNA